MTYSKGGIIRTVEEVVIIIGLMAISLAMFVLVGVETVNCYGKYKISSSILDDVKKILDSGPGSGKLISPDGFQRYSADLDAIHKESQDSGTTSFLYTLTMFAVVTVSGGFYWRAVREFNKAQNLLNELRKTTASSNQIQAAILSLAIGEGIALQIGRNGAIDITSTAPVMRDCVKDIRNTLVFLNENRAAISIVLFDGLRNGVGRIQSFLSDNVPPQNRVAVRDIFDTVDEICKIMDSEDFIKKCKRELESASAIEE
ncbi:MAG: hypothetical protein WAN35_12580 [Terracidiphilus sp.]